MPRRYREKSLSEPLRNHQRTSARTYAVLPVNFPEYNINRPDDGNQIGQQTAAADLR